MTDSFKDEALSNQNKSKVTQDLLKGISDRLSGRTDCANLTYTVDISVKGVAMTPLIYVYPDKHRRMPSDKLDIISYVHRYKFQDIMLDQLEFGTYIYATNEYSKKRRWMRVA